MTTLYIVVITAMLSLANVKDITVQCPTAMCVSEIQDHAQTNQHITRVRVWKAKDYARLPVSGKFIWPPIIDWQPM